MDKKYKKPLAETRKVDEWKCPWCRTLHRGEPDWIKDVCSVFHNENIVCPTCKKSVNVMVSPMFISIPLDDDGEPVY